MAETFDHKIECLDSAEEYIKDILLKLIDKCPIDTKKDLKKVNDLHEMIEHYFYWRVQQP